MKRRFFFVYAGIALGIVCGGPLIGRTSKVNLTGDTKQVYFGKHKREVVDKILARVNGRNIFRSDVIQPRIEKDGGTYSLDELIDFDLFLQKAIERKLVPSPLDIEKHIAMWKDMHHLSHLSPKEFEGRLNDDGLTLEKFRKQLGGILAVRNLKQLEANERVVVTSGEVEAAYKKNPLYTENKYLFQTRFVPRTMAEDEATAVAVAEGVKWDELDWIEEAKIIESMSFAKRLKEGEVSQPVRSEDGYRFIKLAKLEKSRKKTLGESWGEIERALQQEKMERFEGEYLKELRSKAVIVKF